MSYIPVNQTPEEPTILTGSTLRAQVPQDGDSLLALLDATALNGLDEVALLVECSAFSRELESLLSSDLGHGSTGSQVTLEDSIEHERCRFSLDCALQTESSRPYRM